MSGYTAAVAAVAAIAGTAYSVYSSEQAGKQARYNAEAQSEQQQNDADTAASAATVQADRIRRLARNRASEANAALAASGVEVGEGTAININEEIVGNAEEDATMTIFNGERQKRQGYVDSSNTALAGSQAQAAYRGQAASTLISGASSAYSGWKGATSGSANRDMQGQTKALNTNAAWVRNS
ncbi:hypothetical protein DBR00_11475 [Pseudomonas sp. HMWF032]|uniref:hypothetical protein n=1 Tax=Pseudomonas sp. HMWF032 TaxID=2056866 RepID=UPI000D3ABC32|nr:hypothetical protein [Pseudomonas sp. HMWF032]PTS83995.1 hypothetical protein DBR00_11475 [Pseudomonas sp. HMWF032]PTT85350.1 hypothetical protein DBR41_04060 [Pseudomonas sp. HMWF010]